MRDRIPMPDILADLPAGLTGPRLEHARRTVRLALLAVRRGRWAGAEDADAPGIYGFIIVDGTLLRRVTAGHREGAELLGPGDLVQPGREPDPTVSWRAVTDCRLAVLDLRALSCAAAFPELQAGLLAAADTRAAAIARQLLVAQWPSVDARLVATLDMLSDRWGIVSRDGVVLPEFLTHTVLAPLVGARRPSVTTALRRLDSAGTVRRRADGRWVLARTPDLEPLAAPAD